MNNVLAVARLWKRVDGILGFVVVSSVAGMMQGSLASLVVERAQSLPRSSKPTVNP
jgi:hypothetical protein